MHPSETLPVFWPGSVCNSCSSVSNNLLILPSHLVYSGYPKAWDLTFWERTSFLESVQKTICVTQAFGRWANYQRTVLCNDVHILCTLCSSVALCSLTLSFKLDKKKNTLSICVLQTFVAKFCKRSEAWSWQNA